MNREAPHIIVHPTDSKNLLSLGLEDGTGKLFAGVVITGKDRNEPASIVEGINRLLKQHWPR